MKIIKVQDEHEGGQVAYELLREALEKGGKTLGLATGTEVKDLQEDRTYDLEHIRILQKQIRLQLPPPPMKPGDVFPEDQVGG